MMNGGGEEQTILSSYMDRVGDFMFMPDRSKLLIWSIDNGLFTVDAEGGNQFRIVDSGENPYCAPDGYTVIYQYY